MSTLDIFASRLNLAIKASGLSAKQICAECDMAPSSLLNYRRGARACGVDNLAKLAKCLNVSSDYLLGFSDDMNGKNQHGFLSQYLGLSSSSEETLAAIATDAIPSGSSVSPSEALNTILGSGGFRSFVRAYAVYLATVKEASAAKAAHHVRAYFADDERVAPAALAEILEHYLASYGSIEDNITKEKAAINKAEAIMHKVLLTHNAERVKKAYDESFELLYNAVNDDIKKEADSNE